jgi:hypothetical protein
VPERIHAAPQPLQPPRGHPVFDSAPAKSTRLELPQSHNAELPRSNSRDPPVPRRWRDFSMTVMGNSRHRASVAGGA